MATEVSRSLSEINAELAKIDTNIGQCKQQAQLLSKSLSLNPNSLVLASAKYKNLTEQIEEATKKVKLLKEQQKAMVDSGVSRESAEFKDLTNQIKKAESQVRSLKGQLQKVDQQKFNNLEAGLNKLSRACAAMLASVVAIGVAFANSGDEIAKATERFGISAATYQYWNNIFSKTTGNDSGYVQSLQAITTLLGQAAKGSSKAATALALVGLTLEDLQGKGQQEVLELILSQLQGISDEEERLAAATALLGNSGSDIAMVSGLTAEQIAMLNAEMEKAGLITDEQAQKAAALNDAFDNLKNEFKAVTVQLGTALVPALKSLMSLALALTPIITAVAKVMNAIGPAGQVITIVMIGILAIIPKLIIGINSLNVALTALGANPITGKFLVIAAALAAITLGAVGLTEALKGMNNEVASIDTSKMDSIYSKTISLEDGTNPGSINGNTYVTYNDYSSQDVTIDQEVDIDDVIDKLHTKKIQVGG